MTKCRRLFVELLESRRVLSGLGPIQGSQGPEWEQVIITLQDQAGPPQAVASEVIGRFGGRIGHVYEHALNGFSAQLPSAAVAALQNNPLVKTVEADMLLHTTGQTVPTGVMRIGTLGIGTGGQIDVDIAILDTGIQRDHPDLNVVGGVRFYTVNSGPPSRRGTFSDDQYDDDNGHGTHVAGIAAALDNDSGVVGVAPGARLHAVKVLGDSGSGNMSDIIAGVDWVTARADTIEVANMSLGGAGWSPGLYTAIQNSVAAGVVYVVAAGNSGIDIHGSDKTFGTSDDYIPAAFPQVATISAFVDTDGAEGGDGSSWYWSGGSRYLADDTFADFSNFSNSDEAKNQAWLDQNVTILGQERHVLGLGIDLVMPGVDILSTYLNSGYATLSGTSMAAPHAAGLAALHIAANPRPTDAGAEWVYGVRRALIDMGNPWRSDLGLVSPPPGEPNSDSPDKYEENVGWAGPKVVEIGPDVNIVTPTDGVLLLEVSDVLVEATATASGDRTIDAIEFFVGNVSLGIGTRGVDDAWSVTWPTSLYPDGTYTITAVATDSGDKTASHSIQVHLDNLDDPPTVAITSPTGGNVSGTVAITAEATDDRGVEQVEFFVNGTSIGVDQDGTDGWSIEWDTTTLDGLQTITAVAWDTGDNDATSDEVFVTVQNDVATMTATLDGRAIPVNRNFWQAEVTVTVVDGKTNGLGGATVTGRWNTNPTVTGTTGSNGVVTFNSGNIRTNVSSITFSLTGVVLEGYDYTPGDTSITVNSNGSTIVQAARLDAPVSWQTSPADSSTGGGRSASPNGLAGTADPGGRQGTSAADDDAFRVPDSNVPSAAGRNVATPRADAASPGGVLDDLLIADSEAWPAYASAVDVLLAGQW